jgi:hypothetical protein
MSVCLLVCMSASSSCMHILSVCMSACMHVEDVVAALVFCFHIVSLRSCSEQVSTVELYPNNPTAIQTLCSNLSFVQHSNGYVGEVLRESAGDLV